MSKILIVEDDEAVRSSLAEMIEDLGYTAVQARNGRVALDSLSDNEDIAMVITDVRMPEMDGLELIDRMNRDDRLRLLPIIIISGVVGPKEIADVLTKGATALLPKPVKGDDLREYIGRYLKPNRKRS